MHEAEMKDWSPQAFLEWIGLDQGKKRDKLKDAMNHLQCMCCIHEPRHELTTSL